MSHPLEHLTGNLIYLQLIFSLLMVCDSIFTNTLFIVFRNVLLPTFVQYAIAVPQTHNSFRPENCLRKFDLRQTNQQALIHYCMWCQILNDRIPSTLIFSNNAVDRTMPLLLLLHFQYQNPLLLWEIGHQIFTKSNRNRTKVNLSWNHSLSDLWLL